MITAAQVAQLTPDEEQIRGWASRPEVASEIARGLEDLQAGRTRRWRSPPPLDNQWYELSETARAACLALARPEQLRVMAAMRALMVDPTEHNLLAVLLREREGRAGPLIFPWQDIRIACGPCPTAE